MILGYQERLCIQRAAHLEVGRAIIKGLLERPAKFACVDCSRPAQQYDHRDYTQPLKVDPVCRSCNLRRGAALVWSPDGRMPIRHKPGRKPGAKATPVAHDKRLSLKDLALEFGISESSKPAAEAA